MLSLTVFKRNFTPSLGMTLLALFAVLLFLRLGFWQIHRGQEKAGMLAAQNNMLKQSAQEWLPGQTMPKQYQPIKLKGIYGSDLLLLDNQHYQHQFGYHVISPFYLNKELIVLIDRGWIQASLDRSKLPEIGSPKGLQELSGTAYYPSSLGWSLGPRIEKRGVNRWIIEDLSSENLQQVLQKRVTPFIIRLNPNQPQGYVREWTVVSMPPERHYGYALQWFVMALVIVVLYVVLNLKKKP